MALIFPDDTKNDVKYEAKVKFTSRRVKTFDIGFLFEAARDKVSTRDPAEEVSDEEITQQNVTNFLADSKKAFTGSDENLETLKGTKQPLEPYNASIDRTCTLYLPQAVQITDNALYDNVDLGILGSGAEAGFAAGQNVGEAAVGAIKGAVKSIVDTALGNKDFSSEVGRLAVSRASNLVPNFKH